MTTVNNYNTFTGRNWETAAIRNHLAYRGYTAPHTGEAYTEALMMGVSGGAVMGYFSFAYEGYFPLCRILTRNTFDPLETMLSRLGCVQENHRTALPDKAEQSLRDALDSGVPPIVWADAYSLPYNGGGEFPGMWSMNPILVYGLDDASGEALIADRAAAPFRVPADDLRTARGRVKKDKHRLLTLGPPNPDKLAAAVRSGIDDCIALYTESPPKGSKNNFGLQAFKFWAELLTKPKARLSWERVFPPGPEMYAGLRGAYHAIHIFDGFRHAERGLFADFLEEASVILENAALRDAAAAFRGTTAAWDALGLALLPDDVAPFGETRRLVEQRHSVFIEKGGGSLEEVRDCDERLAALRKSMDTDFPLTAAESETMRQGLADLVLALHDLEKTAVETLISAAE
jgi:hypothetical protein